MRHMFLASAAALMTSAVVATPALSQVAPAQQQSAKTLDPNEVVCEKQQEIGSRIASKRVCKTRAQWAEQRRVDRLEIDRVQTRRNCGSGEGGQC